MALVVAVGWLHRKSNLALTNASVSRVHAPILTASQVKAVDFGFDELVADFYWLSFIQYIGDSDELRKNFPLAEKYLEQITELDSAQVKAYYFAAFVLGSEQHKPEVAARILERGIHENPNNWTIPFIAGINQYLYAHDELSAAKYYALAATLPGAPSWIGRQAKILEARIPSIIKEINIWNSIYQNSGDNESVKHRARNTLVQLWQKVYRESPSNLIRRRAASQLHALGATGS